VPEGYYAVVVRELKACGYRYHSQAKGSHERWVSEAGKTLIVPRNLKSRHTANGILRDAGSDKHL
jgi:predicted RNA binding protein YcfA (HicA-like mRNA interferase family)